MGKVPSLVSERSVERLKVERHGVIDGAPDFFLRQNALQLVAFFHANGVLVEDVFVSFRD